MMIRKLIPIKIEQPAVFRRYQNMNNSNDLDFELDFKKAEAEVHSVNQFIRGVLCIPILGGIKIQFIKSDKIFLFGNDLDFIERLRNDNELFDNKIFGRFQYTKSLSAIDKFRFNRELDINLKIRKKLHKICSDLIYQELDKQKKEKWKK